MKKTASFSHTQDHAKPFVVAIGIAFTFLALVVIYIAFTKGGLDIRSRAGKLLTERCYAASVKAYVQNRPVYTCLSGGTLRGSQCCIQVIQKNEKVMATPTPKPCVPGSAGCAVKKGQLMKTQTTVAKPTVTQTPKK